MCEWWREEEVRRKKKKGVENVRVVPGYNSAGFRSATL